MRTRADQWANMPGDDPYGSKMSQNSLSSARGKGGPRQGNADRCTDEPGDDQYGSKMSLDSLSSQGGEGVLG